MKEEFKEAISNTLVLYPSLELEQSAESCAALCNQKIREALEGADDFAIAFCMWATIVCKTSAGSGIYDGKIYRISELLTVFKERQPPADNNEPK